VKREPIQRKELIKYRGDRTQTEMAERYNVSQQAWQKWESGEMTPTVDKMKRLEDDSGIAMEVLFFDAFNK